MTCAAIKYSTDNAWQLCKSHDNYNWSKSILWSSHEWWCNGSWQLFLWIFPGSLLPTLLRREPGFSGGHSSVVWALAAQATDCWLDFQQVINLAVFHFTLLNLCQGPQLLNCQTQSHFSWLVVISLGAKKSLVRQFGAGGNFTLQASFTLS